MKIILKCAVDQDDDNEREGILEPAQCNQSRLKHTLEVLKDGQFWYWSVSGKYPFSSFDQGVGNTIPQ